MPVLEAFIPLSGWEIFPAGTPYLVAGPCSAESEEQVLDTARRLKAAGIGVMRAGLWKPRTRPGGFEGVGERGLPWLQAAKAATGMKACTEVAGARHAEACLEAGLDMVWIGARTSSSPFLVQEIADALSGSGMPVLVKNPLNPDVDLWAGAIERLRLAGLSKVGAVLRGFTSFEKIAYRNAPHWQVAVELRRRFPTMPLLCDPSHMGGDAAYVREISRKALDLGLDGLMIEAHRAPEEALSDARQQITPEELQSMLKGLRAREAGSDGPGYADAMHELRARIDLIDSDLVRLLGQRMDVCREIGRLKEEHNVAILQTGRWDKVLERMVREGGDCGLDRESVTKVFSAIHEVSVAAQDKEQGGEQDSPRKGKPASTWESR